MSVYKLLLHSLKTFINFANNRDWRCAAINYEKMLALDISSTFVLIEYFKREFSITAKGTISWKKMDTNIFQEHG